MIANAMSLSIPPSKFHEEKGSGLGTPRSKDPVADALEMKKRQLEAQQRLLERRREQEMQE